MFNWRLKNEGSSISTHLGSPAFEFKTKEEALQDCLQTIVDLHAQSLYFFNIKENKSFIKIYEKYECNDCKNKMAQRLISTTLLEESMLVGIEAKKPVVIKDIKPELQKKSLLQKFKSWFS